MLQFAKKASVEESVVHALLGKRTNGRSLRRKVQLVIEKVLPNVCGLYSVTLKFSELGPYDDYDMYMRDIAALIVMLLCDPANR